MTSDHNEDKAARPGGARYARHAALSLIGPAGQRKLSQSSVLVLGCGSIGSAQAMLLARAGVGRLILADRDYVQLYNLPTQILYDENDVKERTPKPEAAARRLRAINPEITMEPLCVDVTAGNIEALVGRVDLVIDGTDNFETRFLLNDAAVKAGKPWVYGGVLGTDGMVMAVRPGVGPCLRCLFDLPPPEGRLPTCDAFGVLNAAAVWVASLQVTEAIKVLTGAPHAGHKLHLLDIWGGTVSPVATERKPDCPCCGRRNFEFLKPA
jgi:adenylyltransferase/sulfurtransferase